MTVRTLITVGAIVALAAPVAAEARTIPVKYPATHVKVTKTSPATHGVPHVEPRQLCICVTLQIDRATVQAQADFEAAFNDRMVLRGLGSWEWSNHPTAVAAFESGKAALLAGTPRIDEILAGIEASW